MTETGSAIERFAACLRTLREQAGNPTARALITRAKAAKPQNAALSSSSLSDWFTGKTIPARPRTLEVLISVLVKLAADRAAPVAQRQLPQLMELYRAAQGESRARRGKRRDRIPAPPIGEPIPAEAPVSLLSARFGNVCAFPECRDPLMSSRAGEERFLGAVVHIGRGEKYGHTNVSASQEQISADTNVVLVCDRHRCEVAANPAPWTPERLQSLREAALRTHAVGLRQHLPKLIALHYANPVRLAHIATFQGQTVSLPDCGPVREIRSTNW